MIQDVNVKALKKNAFRYSKVRGETASRVRVPGGLVSAKSMARIVEIAEEFGNGEIFLTNRHVKVAFTGCSNDCAHVALNDFGIIGMTEPQYDPARCIGCGVCVVYCPTRAWTRSPERYFRVKIMGRTGKQNPRLAQDWLRWVDEDSIVKIVKSTYAFIEEYIDPNAPEGKEHIGYIVDRVGFDEFCKWALEDVELPEKCRRATRVYWDGKRYDCDSSLR